MACRGRLVLLQLFISLLLFPICGKLVTRCRTMRTLNLSSTAGGGADWDRLARRIAFGTIAAQLLIVTVYLSVTARRDFSPSRLLTVCSEDVSEHVFHGLEVFVATIVLIVAFLMLAYLELSRASKTQQVDGGKETLKTLLSLLSLTVITAGFAIIFTTSARDSGVTVLVPARLILVLTVALLNLCTQVLPPVLRAAHDKYKERRGGRARRGAVGKAAIDKLVRMQQAQLAQLEVDLAEKQRSLQENLLRLKLLSTPLRQEWCEVGVVPPKAGGDPRSPSSVPKWDKFFVRVFKNKKLVCWASMEDAETDRPRTRRRPLRGRGGRRRRAGGGARHHRRRSVGARQHAAAAGGGRRLVGRGRDRAGAVDPSADWALAAPPAVDRPRDAPHLPLPRPRARPPPHLLARRPRLG